MKDYNGNSIIIKDNMKDYRYALKFNFENKIFYTIQIL